LNIVCPNNSKYVFFCVESDKALSELPNYVYKLGDHEEQCVHFFYKDENSFLVNTAINQLSFKGFLINEMEFSNRFLIALFYHKKEEMFSFTYMEAIGNGEGERVYN